MHVQFASGPAQIPLSAGNFAVMPGGSTTQARTLYFYVQGSNAAGLNLPSAVVGPITIAAGQKLKISLPDTPEANGSMAGWTSFVVSASESTDLSKFRQIARLRKFNYAGIPKSFPLTATLDREGHFLLGQVADDLLAVSGIEGTLRGHQGFVYEYQEVAPEGVAPAVIGNWRRYSVQFETNRTALIDPGGCNQSIRDLTSSDSFDYPCDGSTPNVGHRQTYWMINDGDAEIEAGRRVGLVVRQDGENKSQLFENFLQCVFRGYVNVQTFERRTTFSDGTAFPGVDVAVGFTNQKSDLYLPDVLLPGEAYALEVYPRFSMQELATQAEVAGEGLPELALIAIEPMLFVQAGSYDSSGRILGDSIYPEFDRGMVVPYFGSTVKVLRRSGCINSRVFEARPDVVIADLVANAGDQKIAINSEGTPYRKVGDLEGYEALRAIVSTTEGVGKACSWTSVEISTANSGLNVAISHPVEEVAGLATIRSDYPDGLIRGVVKARLNASGVYIYARKGGVIKRFGPYAIANPEAVTQTVSITDWLAGVTETLPIPTADFGLFAVSGVAASSNGLGNIPTGSIEICCAYNYTGGVTSITHDIGRGCVHTMSSTIAEMEASFGFWSSPCEDLTGLRALPLAKIIPFQTRFVYSVNDAYRFDPYSIGIDDGSATSRYARPVGIPLTSPGRFVRDNSTSWLTGSNPPTGSMGEVGDFYFQANGFVYEKTGATTWELRIRVAISLWHNGSGIPSQSLGEDDDYYIDNLGGLYFKKVSGAWQSQGTWMAKWRTFDVSVGDGLSPEIVGNVGDLAIVKLDGRLYQKSRDASNLISWQELGKALATTITFSNTPGLPSFSGKVFGDMHISSSGEVYTWDSGTAGRAWYFSGWTGSRLHHGPPHTMEDPREGDFCIDSTAGLLHRYSATGWAEPIPLKARFFIRTENPVAVNSSEGLTGDVWLNSTTGELYQKNSYGIWGSKGTLGSAINESWATGNVPPDSTTSGSLGDFYLDKIGKGVYQREAGKPQGGWHPALGFLAKTKNGLLIESGNPLATTGENGDLFYSLQSQIFFHKKDGAWQLIPQLGGGGEYHWAFGNDSIGGIRWARDAQNQVKLEYYNGGWQTISFLQRSGNVFVAESSPAIASPLEQSDIPLNSFWYRPSTKKLFLLTDYTAGWVEQGTIGAAGSGGGSSSLSTTSLITMPLAASAPTPSAGEIAIYNLSGQSIQTRRLRAGFLGGWIDGAIAETQNSNLWTKAQRFASSTLINNPMSGTPAQILIDCEASNTFSLSLSASFAFAIAASNITDGIWFSLFVSWNSGTTPLAPTFSADFVWRNNSSPVFDLGNGVKTYRIYCKKSPFASKLLSSWEVYG